MSEETMRAWLWRGGADQGLVELPRPAPGPDEILIRVEASGLCGTDLRILAGDYGHAAPPLVIGHEFAGTVEQAGPGVTGFAPSDRVAADPNIYCLRCEWCGRRAYNLCQSISAVGITRMGAMAEFVAVPARLAVRLPAEIEPSLAALIEPLACVLHGVERGGVEAGRSLAVYGAGAIGLMAVVVATQLGAVATVVEPHALRRGRALAAGAVEAVAALADGREFDYVLDASGAPAAVADGLTRLRKRGTLIQMGVPPSAFAPAFSPYQLYEREWRLIGSNSVADCYVRAASLMPQIAERLRPLVTHTLPLGETGRAAALMADPAALKVQVDPRL
ncbi:MAG: alcohol dehydrogenase catalytic domain-containing protein [Bifidobacteriaceae bacterium]|jgi:2-desacetyl-2-hydroxyethyl bacteriochlorophyllide A dehydrogenase|nr:alcohol dehydrogenase catalytic domain-containing protein [Bifidobacteriaceae bacterium]